MSESANTATDSLAITSSIQVLTTPVSLTAIRVGKPPSFRCITNECRSYQIAHLIKKFVQRWSDTFALVTAAVTSDGAQHRAVQDVAYSCLRNRRLRISKKMRLAAEQDGTGREVGAGSIAS